MTLLTYFGVFYEVEVAHVASVGVEVCIKMHGAGPVPLLVDGQRGPPQACGLELLALPPRPLFVGMLECAGPEFKESGTG